MTRESTEKPDRLTEAIALARAGERVDAQRQLRQITEEEPDNVAAWIWRADVADGSADKRSFLSEALALEPSNLEAKLALERLDAREGALAQPAEEILFCTVHPSRETMLRCNRCGRPMCTDCAVRHPVGLRCRDCVSETRSPIYQLSGRDGTLAALTALVMGLIAGGVMLTFGNLLFAFGLFFGLILTFIVGGILGRSVASVVGRVVPRKRGSTMVWAVGGGLLVGGLLVAGALWLFNLPLNFVLLAVYLISATTAAAGSLR